MRRWFSRCAEIDGRADAVAKLEVASDEIGVQVREEDMPDVKPVLRKRTQCTDPMSRWGSTTAAVPVASSPMR